MTTIKSLKSTGLAGADAEPLTIEFVTPFMEWSAGMTDAERTIGLHIQAAAIVAALARHVPSGLLYAIHDHLHEVTHRARILEAPPHAPKH